MNADGTPDNVDGLYEQWVASLERDKAKASRAALVAWLVVAVLVVVLVGVLAALRREHALDDDDGQGDELEAPDKEEGTT